MNIRAFLCMGAWLSGLMACGTEATPADLVSDAGPAADGSANDATPVVPGTDAGEHADATAEAEATPPKLRVAEIGTSDNNTCARFEDGSVRCWGHKGGGFFESNADHGRIPGDMGSTLPVIPFGSGRTAKQLSMNGGHACVVLDNGSVKCWGLNDYGALGLGDSKHRYKKTDLGDALPAVDLGTGRTAKMVSAVGNQTCVVLDNDTAKCWGANSSGQLGQGDTVPRGSGPGQMGDSLPAIDFGSGRTVRSIAGTCAVLDNGGVKCFGGNDYAQLGQGIPYSAHAHVGAAPGQMGDSLPYVNLGVGRTAKSIAHGGTSVCALLDNDKVKCWGDIISYEGDTTLRGFAPSEMGDALPFVDLGGLPVKSVTVGSGHACAILANDTLKCWGDNDLCGALGLGDMTDRGAAPQTMGAFLPVVDTGSGLSIKTVKAGSNYTCATFTNGRMKCWGYNATGRLGIETLQNVVGGKPLEMGDNLPFLNLE